MITEEFNELRTKEFLTVTEAIELAKLHGVSLTKPTVIRYCQKFGVGHQLGKVKYAHWIIDRRKWERLIFHG